MNGWAATRPGFWHYSKARSRSEGSLCAFNTLADVARLEESFGTTHSYATKLAGLPVAQLYE